MAELRSSDVLSKQILYKHIKANLPWENGSGGGGGSGSTSEVWLRSDTVSNVQYDRIYKLLQQSRNVIVTFQPDVSKNDVFQSTMIIRNNVSTAINITIYFINEKSETLKLTIRPNYTNLSPNDYVEYNKTDGKIARIEVLSFL